MDCLAYLLSKIDFPLIGYSFGMAYIAILIPMAIALFSGDKEFDVLDRNVILDHVVRAKSLLLFLGMIFIPPIFWNIFPWPIARLIEIAVWIAGLYFMTAILIRSYHWMKTGKFNLRLSYLRNLSEKKDIQESWLSLWRENKIEYQNEIEFMRLFVSKLEYYISNANTNNNHIETSASLLNDFEVNIANRHERILYFGDIFISMILEWRYKVSVQMYEHVKDDKINHWSNLNQLLMVTDSIIKKLIEKSMASIIVLFYSIFGDLNNHLIKHVSNTKYLKNFIPIIFNSFITNFETISDRYSVWDQFPNEWKITISSLKNKKTGVLSISWFNNYISWCISRLTSGSDEYDSILDNVSRNLFPETEPIKWARLLIFGLIPYDPNDRINYVLSKGWTFGVFGRIHSFIVSEEAIGGQKHPIIDDKTAETFELALLVFGSVYSKDNLKQYLNDLNHIKYESESMEEKRRLALIRLFSEFLKYLEDRNSKNGSK